MNLLHRYWFKFERGVNYHLNPLGYGVTAYSYDDAIRLLKEKIFNGCTLPAIHSYKEDIDIQLLDQNHVLPNMGFCTIRGIWFPKGYE